MDKQAKFIEKYIKSIFILLGIVLILVMCYFITQKYGFHYLETATGSSMKPTLTNKNFCLIERINDKSDLDRMDIVLAEVDGKKIIKRIVGKSGDTIRIINNLLYVNGELVKESYVQENKQPYMDTNDIEWVIPEKTVFLLGDNRDNSNDSRQFGYVSIEKILGKVIKSYSFENELENP